MAASYSANGTLVIDTNGNIDWSRFSGAPTIIVSNLATSLNATSFPARIAIDTLTFNSANNTATLKSK